ncbi:GrlR family regulatory protein [Enterobacillus tribolii]|uniref:Type III secretion system (T3SS) negative regulator GrlR n=1 Tax=Enterobacillus tribolii TaxID=1487935 RepID=A0A370QES5_9GAMM|nr:GrlR family regulatory protein [Enterobacillus tribolii]MBW7984160.1 negative regulator GrlR [Enterobacillus tribolii]RDK86779.1 type III secretion system (T3SS) negative regulator GrlR [Enterobacillus tribolii]
MKNGIYYVTFSRHYQIFGEGTVVVMDNVVNGGDVGFMYQGQIHEQSLVLHVYQHDYRVPSLFKGILAFKFILTISDAPYGYTLEGNVDGIDSKPVSLKAKYIGAIFQDASALPCKAKETV